MGNRCFRVPKRPAVPPGSRPPNPGESTPAGGNNSSTDATVEQQTPSTSDRNVGQETPSTSSRNVRQDIPSTSSSNVGQASTSGARADVADHPEGRMLEEANLHEFTLAELQNATKNFRPDLELGEGGFGKVYKGWIDEVTMKPAREDDGMIVAVKKLNRHGDQGFREWQTEIRFLGRLSHPNLVKLLGYCEEDGELLLVYEYMNGGNLENRLFTKRRNCQVLSWDLRMKIAIDAARGLAFLHTSEKRIIYRDFKTSNILLDSDFNAKLSDFGLAKDGPPDGHSHVLTRIMGTYGYAAPEYRTTGLLYVQSDVYCFGVVLLEMITGKPALDRTRSSKCYNVVDYVKSLMSGKESVNRVMDPRLMGAYPSKAATEAVKLALRCTLLDLYERPPMKEVVLILEQIQSRNRSGRS